MLVVIDTNIWVSARIKPNGNAGLVINQWEHGNLDVAFSLELLQEFKQVFCYPKLQKYIKISQTELDEYVSKLELYSTLVSLDGVNPIVPRDSNDNKVLATFIVAKADWLIIGDNDLLELRDKYNIIKLSDFVEKYL